MVSAVGSELIVPEVAVMFVFPVVRNVTKPLLPVVLLTVATVLFDEVQVTVWVMSCVPVPANVPMA